MEKRRGRDVERKQRRKWQSFEFSRLVEDGSNHVGDADPTLPSF